MLTSKNGFEFVDAYTERYTILPSPPRPPSIPADELKRINEAHAHSSKQSKINYDKERKDARFQRYLRAKDDHQKKVDRLTTEARDGGTLMA